MTKLIVDGQHTSNIPDPHVDQGSQLDKLLDQFEKLSPEERRRDIERAGAFLRANGIHNLREFDKWMKQ